MPKRKTNPAPRPRTAVRRLPDGTILRVTVHGKPKQHSRKGVTK